MANTRQPVRFSQAVAAAGADYGTFIEVSPHPILTHAITETLERLAITTALGRWCAMATIPSLSTPI